MKRERHGMNKIVGQYKICAILCSVLATVFIILHFILRNGFDLLMIGGACAIAAVAFWIAFGVWLKKMQDKQREERQLEEEFVGWMKQFEPLTRIAAELAHAKPGSEKFSKFGGLPVVPTEFEWPTYQGRPIPFVLQLDFSEINPNGILKNFPTSGLMYLFIEETINEEREMGLIRKILFFDHGETLVCANEPQGLQTKYKEIFVASYYIKTYPDVEDCDEAFHLYCERPHGGMDDAYNGLCWENAKRHLVGGWPSQLQGGGFMKDCMRNEDGNWMLLLQIRSDYSTNGDGDFMWGDAGIVYVYIRETDLIARNFDNVKIDMQCY